MEKVTVVEGKSTKITVKAKANPDEITYKWKKNGSPVVSTKGKVTVEDADLHFVDVSRKDKGKYEAEATNKEGTTSISVELDVQCKLLSSLDYRKLQRGGSWYKNNNKIEF